MNKKSTLGKVVGAAHGYNIRIMLESKTTEKTTRDGKPVRLSSMGDTGKLGVYAGPKKLLKGDFTSKEDALAYCNELFNKKK